MKIEDAEYILKAIDWINDNTTVTSEDMETYGNLFMNSQNLLIDEVNSDRHSDNNCNMPLGMRFFFIAFNGEGSGSIWFHYEGFPSHFKIKEAIIRKFPKVKNPAIVNIIEMSKNDYMDFICV